jgi:hypothetical protein
MRNDLTAPGSHFNQSIRSDLRFLGGCLVLRARGSIYRGRDWIPKAPELGSRNVDCIDWTCVDQRRSRSCNFWRFGRAWVCVLAGPGAYSGIDCCWAASLSFQAACEAGVWRNQILSLLGVFKLGQPAHFAAALAARDST